MKIALYQRTYPAKDAPVSFSFFPFGGHQKHTFTVGDDVYQAECSELEVIVPDEAKIDPLKGLLSWAGEKGTVRSTAREVFDLAQAGASDFRMAGKRGS